MREILFKAKRIDNGEWVEGYHYKRIQNEEIVDAIEKCDGTICSVKYYQIIPETLCQYTGLADKNGQKIWENDIVKKEFYTDYEAFANSEEYIGVVKYEDCAWCVSYERNGYKCNSPIFMAMEYHDAEHFDVIGNIFENPELIKA